MKLAEGAVFEFAPENSDSERNQYWITDGSTRWGLASEPMKAIWESHQLNGMKPVATSLWQTLSGQDDAIQALSVLSFVAQLKTEYDQDTMALAYGCYDARVFDRFDCFCPNQPIERSAKKSLGLEPGGLICPLQEGDLFNFFFTTMTIENEGSRPVKDLRLTLRDTFVDRRKWAKSYFEIGKQCGLDGRIDGDDFPIYAFHDCVHRYLSDLNEEFTGDMPFQTLGVSSLEPGEEIVLLLNAYVPDAVGLPETYIAGHMHVDRLDYFEGGRAFTILSPSPLAERRLPLIESPDGGIGGQ
ncbi:MAG: hypothetical protein AAF231_06480 [Pseudomonadota bacterium]